MIFHHYQILERNNTLSFHQSSKLKDLNYLRDAEWGTLKERRFGLSFFDGLMETCIEQIDKEWNDAFEITMLNIYMDLVLE